MIAHRLTPADILIATLTDSLLLAVNIILYIILAFCFVKAKSKRSRMTILIFDVILPFAYATPILVKTLKGWDWYGYEVSGEELHVRAWPVDEVVNLRNSTILLTDSDEWKPKIRKFGFKAGDVSMGKYVLKNGMEAVVFKHGESERSIVINTSGEYYVLMHPGVEKLHSEMTGIGGNANGMPFLPTELLTCEVFSRVLPNASQVLNTLPRLLPLWQDFQRLKRGSSTSRYA